MNQEPLKIVRTKDKDGGFTVTKFYDSYITIRYENEEPLHLEYHEFDEIAEARKQMRPLRKGTLIDYCGHRAVVFRDTGGPQLTVEIEGIYMSWDWSFEGIDCTVVSEEEKAK